MERKDVHLVLPGLTNCLLLITTTASEEEVSQGWENLRELEDRGTLECLIGSEYAVTITRAILDLNVLNVHNVPKLMIFFGKYLEKERNGTTEDEDALAKSYVTFIQTEASKDITLLVEMVEILKDYPIYGGSGVSDVSKTCRAIVNALGGFQMPIAKEAIVEFRDSAGRIRDSLRIVCKSSSGTGNSDLITVCLETVYHMISDTERLIERGPALIDILELVETKYISQAVKWIMSEARSDSQLERSLRVLCHWIPNWLSLEHLSRWIMELITGLEAAKKYAILNRVASSYLQRILFCAICPMAMLQATFLVTVMLYRQPNPKLFHRIIQAIEIVLEQLKKQDTETARKCMQDLVDVSKALMERFPGDPAYESLEKSFPVQPRIENVIVYRDEYVWADEYEKFSYGLEVPSSPSSDHGKVGLTNLGNTCYMNSVLQALAMTRQFSLEVMRHESLYEKKENRDAISMAEEAAQIMPKLRNLFALLFYSRRSSLSPTEILLASRPEYFAPKQQQDSSEFLCHLLDVLYEQEKSLLRKSLVKNEESAGTKGKGKRSGDAATPDRGCIKRWTTEEDLSEGISLERKTSQSLGDFSQGDVDERIGQTTNLSEGLSDCHSDSTDSGIQSVDGTTVVGGGSRESGVSGKGGEGEREREGVGESAGLIDETSEPQSILVHRVFGGESKITYQCAQCDTSSHNTDRFRDLQLCFPEEISDNQDISVQDLINYYLTPERLTDDNKYRCDKCAKLCDAQRIIKILRAPVHLILTLKHFHYDPESQLRTKLRHKVTYNETIQLPVSPSDTGSSSLAETYRLYAAVVHSGYSMDYGHYVTYARDSKHHWFKFNDSFVSRTSLENFNALEPPVTPYILFYEKIGSSDENDLNGQEEKPEFTTLSKFTQELVEKDRRAYEDELRNQSEKKRIANRGALVSYSSSKHNDNSDDENPPPSSCRGHIDIPANRFLF